MSITMQEIDEWLAALEGVTPGPVMVLGQQTSTTTMREVLTLAKSALRGDGGVKGLTDRVATIIAANAIGGSETDDAYAALSRLIAAKFLGVKADEQDTELEDHDWMMIIDALSHKALVLAEQEGK